MFHYMSRRALCFYAVVKTETADWNGWLWLEGGADIFSLIANSPKCSHNPACGNNYDQIKLDI